MNKIYSFKFENLGSVKIEIRPAGSFQETDEFDEEEEKSSKKNRDENWNSKSRREPFKQLNDPKIVKQFLKGEHCLHGGGSGWWKFEFCFGEKLDGSIDLSHLTASFSPIRKSCKSVPRGEAWSA